MIEKIFILCVGSIVVIAWAGFIDDTFMPFEEFSNADIAYEWKSEQTNCTGYNCGPGCSLQACMWIDDYRVAHNLTCEEFVCAVWFNDQSDWFYY